MSAPTLRRQALATLLPTFPGIEPPTWALRLVAEGLAGFSLFGYNIADRSQLAALTASLRSARPDVIIATDEEGGDVTRLSYAEGSPYPGNAALGVVDDVAITRAVYRAIGAELAAAGITLDMAPAVDVNSAEDNPAIGTRSFGADPQRVAAHTAAAVHGLQEAGVAACAKHFPGHGATAIDSHLELPVVDASAPVLRGRELPPFAAAIEAGARAIMTAHIRVPELTGLLPATFSPAVLVDLLRGELRFTGAVVSDALEMRGASAGIGVPEAAVRALIAGNDLLCFGGELGKSPDAAALALVEATVTAIGEAVRHGRLSEQRLAEAADRAAGLGGTPGPGTLADPGLDPRVREGAALGLSAARRAIRLEGDLPAAHHKALLVQLESQPTMAVGQVPWGLANVVTGVETMRVVERAGTDDLVVLVDEIVVRAGDRPVVVVSRDTHRHRWARTLVETLIARHAGVVLVEMGWPARWRPAGLRAYLATFGAAQANAQAAIELLQLGG
ncbi:MAG TPA: glycoside hydrolase family 3 N-terminal domain-containing protein [Micromonosporaceae bacterium]